MYFPSTATARRVVLFRFIRNTPLPTMTLGSSAPVVSQARHFFRRLACLCGLSSHCAPSTKDPWLLLLWDWDDWGGPPNSHFSSTYTNISIRAFHVVVLGCFCNSVANRVQLLCFSASLFQTSSTKQCPDCLPFFSGRYPQHP